VVAVALGVMSAGTSVPRAAGDGSQLERPGVSVMQAVPENETVAAGTHPTGFAPFEERYIFIERFGSFDQRFVDADGLVRRASASVMNGPLLPQYAIAAEAEPWVPEPDRPAKGAAPAGAAAAPRSVAHASLNNDVRAPKVRQASLSSSPDGQSRTAIYDISAKVVYLPNGRTLEAHSGLGSYMDDPRYVHVKREGPTPPNTYRMVLRENLFHGVRAIRLIPVGGGDMFGREGILAHHYLLGPNGQSNGCVSFADYPAFLNAYLNGEIDRLVVVERLENPPGQMIAAGWVEKAFKGLIKTFERGSGT
jgi:type VI secretion system (T6SS) effector TldE1-like protein